MKQNIAFGVNPTPARLFGLAALVLSLTAGSAAQAGHTHPGATDRARDLRCLALNIYFEARSEPEIGKFAVGHVVMNRVANRRFPKSICKVVRQGGELRRNRCQFSWWCDGLSDKPRDAAAWRESRRIASLVYIGARPDPTGGALWYHAEYVQPDWRNDFQRGPKIGRHQFYAIDRAKRGHAGTLVSNLVTRPAPPRIRFTTVQGDDSGALAAGAATMAAPIFRRDDATKGMLMVFGFGLIGLGLAGFRRKPLPGRLKAGS
jgi:Cell Wall Hydrolase